MKKTLALVLAAASLSVVGMSAAKAADITTRTYEEDDRNGVKIGYLDCEIGGGVGYVIGSAKEIDCTFKSTIGRRATDHYTGAIKKLGIDLGFTTQSRVIWAVFAPTAGYHHGSLSGLYLGANAEVTIGAGVGANVLFGGTAGSIHLQPVSVTGQIGLDVALAGASVTLASAE